MKFPIIILLMFLTSCTFDQTIEYYVDPTLKPHVDAFYFEAEKRGINLCKCGIIVKFDYLNFYGISEKVGDQWIVTIDIDRFERHERFRTEYKNEYVVFHELGHALLGRKHTTQQSIMNDETSFVNLFHSSEQNRSMLLDELFIHRLHK